MNRSSPALQRTVRTYQPPTTGAFPSDDTPTDLDTAQPLDELAGLAVCLLIGEPGSGKSHSLLHLSTVIENTIESSRPMLEDLRTHTITSLERDLFDPILTGEHPRPTHLLLDSLDECRVRIDRFVPFIRRRLIQTVSAGIHVIATCRTSELAYGILKTFSEIGGDDCIKQLVPLRNDEITHYLELSGINSREAMEWLEEKRLLSIARIPSALRLLTQIAVEKPEIVTDAADLYAYTMQRALEASEARNPGPGGSGISPRTRGLSAERIAGICSLSGRPDIWLADTTPESESVSIYDLIGNEVDDPFHEEISAQAIRTVLDTEIFAQSGPNQRTFIHRSVASYLTARWIRRRRLREPQLRTLLCGSLTGRSLVPALREVGAWLVALEPGTYPWIAESDPLALIRAKQVPDSKDIRQIIVDSLIEQSRELIYRLSWSDSLSDLEHPGLRDQLERHLTSTGSEGYISLRILRDSYMPGLNHLALDTVLNGAHPSVHRTMAFEILVASDDLPRLREVLDRTEQGIVEDEDRDLLGHILEYAWPEHLRVDELWGRLQRPNESYFGKYSIFLSGSLFQRMSHKDRVWFAQRLVSEWKSQPDKWDWLVEDERLVSALAADLVVPESTASIDAAAELSILLLEQKHKRVIPVNVEDVDTRRLLTGVMLDSSSEAEYLASLLSFAWDPSETRWVSRSDFAWALDRAKSEAADGPAPFTRLAGHLFDPDDEEHVRRLKDAEGTPTWEKLQHLADPTFWEERNPFNSPEDEEEPRISHESFIASFDDYVGQSVPAPEHFWLAVRLLEVDFERGYFSRPTEVDLRRTAGFSALDEARQGQVFELGRRLVAQPHLAQLPLALKPNTIYFALESAYRLLYLLEVTNDPAIQQMTPEAWGALAEAALVYPAHYGNVDGDRPTKQRLLARVSRTAPASLATAIRRALDNAAATKERYWGLPDLKLALTAEVNAVLRDELVKRRKPNIEECLNLLLPAEDTEALKWCDRQLKRARDIEILAPIVSAFFSRSLELGLATLATLNQRDASLAQQVALSLAGSYRTRETTIETDAVTLASTYEWLYRAFPPGEDPVHDGIVHWVGPREEVGQWRDSFLRTLTEMGTPSSLKALEQMAARNPDMSLDWSLSRSRELVLQSSWVPPEVPELLNLLRSDDARLIRSSGDLQSIVLEQLATIQQWIVGENPQAFALWNVDKAPGKPKEENSISDWYCHALRVLLSRAGVVINREVEVRRSPGAGAGQRQDIRIEAINSNHEHWEVVVEVKGCWNAGVRTDLQNQLAGRYLAEGGLSHGIYLVACFPPNQVQPTSRSRTLSKHTWGGLQEALAELAKVVDPRLSVVSVVHQVPLPPQHLDPGQ